MTQLAADPKWIIPGHDPLVMTKFKEVVPGVVKIQLIARPCRDFYHWDCT